MAEHVLVRCPVCRREHRYNAPVYPCGCGSPVELPLPRATAATQVRHRTWAGSWVSLRCAACGRVDQWPQPEFGCGCGATLRVPVAPAPASPRPAPVRPPAARQATAPPVPRPPFRPVTIRTAYDARNAAAQYLRWLGFGQVRMAERTPASGVDVRGTGVVAHVDPSTTPAGVREVETLWLTGLNDAAEAVCFALAGYVPEARTRADELSLPLFVLDLTGTPSPVNDAAGHLLRTPR